MFAWVSTAKPFMSIKFVNGFWKPGDEEFGQENLM